LFLTVRWCLLFTAHANVVCSIWALFEVQSATKRYSETAASTRQCREVFKMFARCILGILYESHVAHLAERNVRHGQKFYRRKKIFLFTIELLAILRKKNIGFRASKIWLSTTLYTHIMTPRVLFRPYGLIITCYLTLVMSAKRLRQQRPDTYKRWARLFQDEPQKIKVVFYKEIKKKSAIRRLKWAKYLDAVRFNAFSDAFYNKTGVCIEFARRKIYNLLR